MKTRRRSLRVAFAVVLAFCLFVAGRRGIARQSKNLTIPGNHNGTLAHGGYHRTYFLHVPPSYDGKKPVPLVMMLHGAGGSGEQTASQGGWNAKADKEGFIVVYPDALPAVPQRAPSFQNNPRFWYDFSGRGKRRGTVDDVGYLTTLVKELQGKLAIDPKRVYATGFSSGSSMTFALASKATDTFAAFAPVAGHYWSKGTIPNAKPTLLIFGDTDPLNPMEGGKVKQMWGEDTKPKVMDTVDGYRKAIGAIETAKTLSDTNGVKTVRYEASKPGGASFTFILIAGQGHTWPGGKERLPERIVGKQTNKLNATDRIWEFFTSVK